MNTRTSILFVALAIFAVPALADDCDGIYPDVRLCGEGGGGGWSDFDSYQAGEYMDNPCTAVQDWVWVEYSVEVYQEGSTISSGEERVLFDESTTLGGSYAASGSTQSDVASRQSYSLRKYHKVNTSDDFHVVTVLTFDPATRQTSIARETACGNGMPHSQE